MQDGFDEFDVPPSPSRAGAYGEAAGPGLAGGAAAAAATAAAQGAGLSDPGQYTVFTAGFVAAMGARAASETTGSTRRAATPLVDTKATVKPPAFDGNEGKWKQFRFTFEAWVGLLNEDLGNCMDQVAARSEPLLSIERLGEDKRRMGRLLYQILASNL